MSDWDNLADDLALAWWLSDRDKAREAAAREDAERQTEQRRVELLRAASQAVRDREWAFRREVALHGAPEAARRWEAYVLELGGPVVVDVVDEAAVQYLATLGFTRPAAAAALRAAAGHGATVEERTVEAILTQPPGTSP